MSNNSGVIGSELKLFDINPVKFELSAEVIVILYSSMILIRDAKSMEESNRLFDSMYSGLLDRGVRLVGFKDGVFTLSHENVSN